MRIADCGLSVAGTRAFFGAVAIVLLLSASCDRSDHRSDGSDPEVATRAVITGPRREVISPTQTVRRVHQLRIAGQVAQLEKHLLPSQRPYIVELIQSIDQLLSANRVLQASIAKHLGSATAIAFDRSEAANAIGVFSKDLEVLNERIEGDRAVVTIQVGGRVPLEEVQLVREQGRWLIQTDPPIPEVAKELRKLADVLVQAARRLEVRRITAAELKR